MKQTLVEDDGLLRADAQAAKVLHPTNGSFDRPSSSVATQQSSVLCDLLRPPIRSMRCGHLDDVVGHFLVQSIALVIPVPDDPLGYRLGRHQVKQSLNSPVIVGGG
ncbi:MAG: hypothetical protein NZ740_03930 [Kiritimatiellae bacterium]|nr:hypothetical protein [Kiritimatiellia bacterium]MDW8458238.1 hypothetical protein [Verrucomicrobiota bacterium]